MAFGDLFGIPKLNRTVPYNQMPFGWPLSGPNVAVIFSHVPRHGRQTLGSKFCAESLPDDLANFVPSHRLMTQHADHSVLASLIQLEGSIFLRPSQILFKRLSDVTSAPKRTPLASQTHGRGGVSEATVGLPLVLKAKLQYLQTYGRTSVCVRMCFFSMLGFLQRIPHSSHTYFPRPRPRTYTYSSFDLYL